MNLRLVAFFILLSYCLSSISVSINIIRIIVKKQKTVKVIIFAIKAETNAIMRIFYPLVLVIYMVCVFY